MITKPYRIAWNKGMRGQYKICQEGRERMSLSRRGEKHPNWKGGYSISPNGYRLKLIRKPGPGRGKYVLEHRYFMEREIGRKLLKHEVVHHKNHNKLDNRISNLEVKTMSAHAMDHANFYIINAYRKSMKLIGKINQCSMCNKFRKIGNVKDMTCATCYRKQYGIGHFYKLKKILSSKQSKP